MRLLIVALMMLIACVQAQAQQPLLTPIESHETQRERQRKPGTRQTICYSDGAVEELDTEGKVIVAIRGRGDLTTTYGCAWESSMALATRVTIYDSGGVAISSGGVALSCINCSGSGATTLSEDTQAGTIRVSDAAAR